MYYGHDIYSEIQITQKIFQNPTTILSTQVSLQGVHGNLLAIMRPHGDRLFI